MRAEGTKSQMIGRRDGQHEQFRYDGSPHFSQLPHTEYIRNEIPWARHPDPNLNIQREPEQVYSEHIKCACQPHAKLPDGPTEVACNPRCTTLSLQDVSRQVRIWHACCALQPTSHLHRQDGTNSTLRSALAFTYMQQQTKHHSDNMSERGPRKSPRLWPLQANSRERRFSANPTQGSAPFAQLWMETGADVLRKTRCRRPFAARSRSVAPGLPSSRNNLSHKWSS